jgi:DeoR family glycerol-3-phosphate regulon repressor
MAGGELRSDNGAAFGVSAIEFISHFTVGHAVISTGAIDAAIGVMDYDLEEAEFARAVLAQGRRAVVVTDHTKFGRQGLVRVCDFGAITDLFAEKAPPRDIAAALKTAGVNVALA